ncbi:hypothetical protein BX666DRAFT_1965900 [Dichotomocladium elegans]|nr:hypothetical protein BX666DRAFT_1965900 [Dichotomocladium elegans]
MAAQNVNSTLITEDSSTDKLGNTVATEHEGETREPTKREIRDAERRARLGPAVTPPDRKRGTDRGIDSASIEGQRGQDEQYEQRRIEQLEQLEQKNSRRQFDRHGGYGHRMMDKKSKRGWGDPLHIE